MKNAKTIEWVLRIGVAGEFLGHGLLAIEGKADWIKWISMMIGTSATTSGTLLWWIGLFDVVVALIILFRPINIFILWAAFWGFWTALVRPIVGVGWLDFIERFANIAAPLALLLMRAGGWPRSWKEWWR